MDTTMKLGFMALLLFLLTAPALAEPPRHGGGGWHGDRHQNYRGPRVDPGSAFAGAIIGSWLWRQLNPPPPVVIQEAPKALVPWTPEWYEFCTGRFRSFNEQTGYYMGFDGQPHFCR